MRPGDNNIRYWRRSRIRVGNHDVDTVDRQARRISRSAAELFVNDDSSARYANRLIRKRGYHDKFTVDAEVIDHHTTRAGRRSTIVRTRALGTDRHKIGGKDVAAYIRQNEIFGLSLRAGLVKGALSNRFEKTGGERAIEKTT